MLNVVWVWVTWLLKGERVSSKSDRVSVFNFFFSAGWVNSKFNWVNKIQPSLNSLDPRN